MGKFNPQDSFFKKAKQEGYRARSAYKLKEAIDRYHFIKKGDRVLDIGCAPGSFMQVISPAVGQEGMVIGIDLLPLRPLNAGNTRTITGDVRGISVKDILISHGLKHFDVITCDIAPNLTGIREVDNKNVEELYQAVFHIMEGGLKKGGTSFLKLFFSDIFSDINMYLKKQFKRVIVFKPAASRSMSSEIYLLCVDRKSGCMEGD